MSNPGAGRELKPANPLRVGGVPEHFNLPWHRLLESGQLANRGIDISWRDFHGGTGSMVASLNDEALDVAMLLTEGAVAGIAAGGRFKIVSFYTLSPIVWGIHVPAHSDRLTIDDIRGARYAISRFGSGSHLMAYVHARDRGWPLDELAFEVVRNLDGARAAFRDGKAQAFLWERFTTQPLVDNGEFRRVGDFPTPWSCFAVCASERILEIDPQRVATALELVFRAATDLSRDPQRCALIAARYGLKEEAVEEWLSITRWAETSRVDEATIKFIATTLNEVGLTDIDFVADDYIKRLDMSAPASM